MFKPFRSEEPFYILPEPVARSFSMSSTTRYRLTDRVLHRQLGKEAIVIDLLQDNCFEVNEVAYRIVELLQSSRTLEELVTSLTDEYEVDPAECRQELHQFLDQLETDGLLLREST